MENSACCKKSIYIQYVLWSEALSTAMYVVPTTLHVFLRE